MRRSIGIDIVDLTLEEPALHPRYIQRVLTSSERAELKGASDLWRFWAAKEAAFKALSGTIPGLIFAPQSFEFNPKVGLVSYNSKRLAVLIESTSEFILALAVAHDGKFDWSELKFWVESSALEPSQAVRILAIEKISKRLNLESRQLSIKSDQDGRPHLLIDSLDSAHAISFSHHGKFVACAHSI